MGAAVGIAGGLLTDGYLVLYSLKQASEGNYLPLGVLIGANLLSGVFESGRLSKSKQERMELLARREAKKEKESEEVSP